MAYSPSHYRQKTCIFWKSKHSGVFTHYLKSWRNACLWTYHQLKEKFNLRKTGRTIAFAGEKLKTKKGVTGSINIMRFCLSLIPTHAPPPTQNCVLLFASVVLLRQKGCFIMPNESHIKQLSSTRTYRYHVPVYTFTTCWKGCALCYERKSNLWFHLL